MKRFVLILLVLLPFSLFSQKDKYYESIMLFSNVLNHIKVNYLEDKDANELIEAAIEDGIFKKLDPHTHYFRPQKYEDYKKYMEGKFYETGIKVEIINDKCIVSSIVPESPAYFSEIAAGDIILSIDDVSVKEKSVPEIELMLCDDDDTEVKIELQNQNLNEYLVTLERAIPSTTTINDFLVFNSVYGYIKINEFEVNTGKEFREIYNKLENDGMEKLIIDLRGNGGGTGVSAYDIVSCFLPEDKLIVYNEGRKKDLCDSIFTSGDDLSEEIPIIILIDRGTASASEVVTCALQDHDRALVVGTNSFGKGLGMMWYYLSNGGAILMTCMKYYTPTGRFIQRDYKNKSFEDYRNEVNNFDSSKYASLPEGATMNGRKIKVGGGLFPDVFIDEKHIDDDDLFLIKSTGLVNKFADEYINSNKENLKKYDINKFKSEFSLNDEIINGLWNNILQRKNKKYDLKPETKEYLNYVIKYEIARKIWNKETALLIKLKEDIQFLKAVESFNDLDKMLKP